MPIKDPQKHKEYNHEWYLRKKAGLTTRRKPKLTKEQLRENQRKTTKECRKNKITYRRNKINEKLGNRCVVCNGNYYLSLHRKDGKPHKLWREMTNNEFNELLNSDDYIQLCHHCHKSTHWCMVYLNMDWNEISSKITLTPINITIGSIIMNRYHS